MLTLRAIDGQTFELPLAHATEVLLADWELGNDPVVVNIDGPVLNALVAYVRHRTPVPRHLVNEVMIAADYLGL